MNHEDRLQASIVKHLRTVAPQILVFSIPNGGHWDRDENARLKWTGLLAGIPDLGLVLPGGRFAFIEVKAPTGRLSEAQEEVRMRLIRLGHSYLVARSISDVDAALVNWQIETVQSAASHAEVA